jgi:hypothetical protein
MNPELGVISVASPCSVRWESMLGDARVRHCGKCDKNVYSLDAMTTDEVRALVLEKEGKVCWRFFVRKDGTVLTKDCPVGLKRIRLRMNASVMAAFAICLASAAGLLRDSGFWNSSQVLGSWSARISSAAPVVPVPLRAANPHKAMQLGGM